MSFGSNLSAFGMKPANTTNTTGTSIFGQPAKPPGTSIFGGTQPQQQPNTSLFGSTNATNTNTNPLFGGNTGGNVFGQQNQQNQQQQPATGTNLFGQPSQQQPAMGTGTSLFGQPAQQQQPAGVFGQPAQQQSGTGTGAGLFGQSTTGGTGPFGQPAQQQQPSTGTGLFGQQQQPAGTGLFGQQQQQPTGGGLFGQSQQQPAAGLGLFGQQPQQQQQPNLFGGGSSIFGTANNASTTNNGGGLFGSTNTAAAGNTFGGGMFGAKPAQSTFGASIAPQQAAGPPPFTKTTKFNDLPDEIKRQLEQIDTHIQGRIQISKDLHQRKLGEEPTKGQELIRSVHKELAQTGTTIRNDLHFTRDLKAKADQAVQDTIIATRIIDGFRNSQNSGYLKDHASFPLEFFTRVTTQIRERLVWYKQTIDQIERKLASMTNQTHITPQGITTTLQAQHTTFLSLAAKTAALDTELQKIKALYTQLWRARTGSVRDPFEGNVDDDGAGGTSGLGMSMSGLSVGS
ncbi:Nucleoporin nup49/NSP49 (Nuclear pore protein nup49/NSP49) [Stygiomarasmius scandens]|uniref:Nucleoporin nup49/NSP49 (Nuclear pore protein nup49/NSP49) n=1 Tax=Marasmiellus scandens TaxID=2682957 RepID=A0ABR1JPJ1_9AGAR